MASVGSKVDFAEINSYVENQVCSSAPDRINFTLKNYSPDSHYDTKYITSHYNKLVPLAQNKHQIYFYSSNQGYDGCYTTISIYDNDTDILLYSQRFNWSFSSYHSYLSLGAKNLRITAYFNKIDTIINTVFYIRRAQWPLENGMYIKKWNADYTAFETGIITPTLSDYINNKLGGEF